MAHTSPTTDKSTSDASEAKAKPRLFDRIFSLAGSYLGRITVYLGSIAALVIAYRKLIIPSKDQPPGLANWTLFLLAGVPLLCALGETFCQWRQRRRKQLIIDGQVRAAYFVIGPRTAKDHDTFRLPHDTHRTVLDWVRAAPHRILHLTGLSGVGKSSLIQAWLIPELEAARTHRVILLRSFDDPLAALRVELLKIWKSPPERATAPGLSLDDLILLAEDYLAGKHQRLLIIFDQFEEFFILHPESRRSEALRAFFHGPPVTPGPNGTILLSYRKDHAHALAPLQLPPVSFDPNRNLTVNGFALRPFTIAEAKHYFEDSKLGLSPDRIQLALSEAAGYEETRAHIRPIVMNLLGRVLADLSGRPDSWKYTRGLVRDKMREWVLSTRLQENIRPLLERLVSTSGTVQPRTEGELGALAHLTPGETQSVLADLETTGLLRCLTPRETAPDRRIWQVSHDFIARLFALIVESLNRTLWRTLRPWLAPAALALWLLGAVLIWPSYQENRAIRELGNMGFKMNTEERSATLTFQLFGEYKKWPDLGGDLRRAKSALQVFQPRKVDFSGWPDLKDVAVLQGLTKVEHLDLSGCTGLRSTQGLPPLPALTTLSLVNCTGLHGADALQGLAGLRSLKWLYLDGCPQLEQTGALAGLLQLETLSLVNCTGLHGADAFQGLAGLGRLKALSLEGCTGLEQTGALAGLGQLEGLSMQHCTGLQGAAALQGLTGLRNLKWLDLTGCTSLERGAILAKIKELGLKCEVFGP